MLRHDFTLLGLTICVDVSGHPHALLMLEKVIEYINTHEGVEWVTMEQISDDFKRKNPPPKGALLPAKPGEILKNPKLELERAQ